MNKDVRYNGYSAQPSDYECPDGDLALSLNLISEDSHVKPLAQPPVVFTMQAGERLVYVHTVQGGSKNYILARGGTGDSFELFWLGKSPEVKTSTGATHIATFNGLLDIAAIGNTLILALKSGLQYLLWKDGGYILLGARPPFISIDFGMCRVGTLDDSKQYEIPGRFALGGGSGSGASTPHPLSKTSKEELAAVTEMVYGLLNPAIAENVTSKGLFYQPFFVRYAYRLYDGTYTWHSAPILMLPNVTPPIIRHTDDGSQPSADSTVTATFTLDVDYFALAYRILTDGVAKLADWADLVAGIDVFVSATIYTYDQSKDLQRLSTDLRNMLLSLYDWNPDGLDLRVNNVTPPSSVFTGHYADSLTSKYIDHTMSTAAADSYKIINISQHERLHENIRSAHDFYKIAEIDIKDITPMTEMTRLKLVDSDLSSLVAKQTLPDDYQSHYGLAPSSLYAFNSRLNLAGVRITPAEPFPIRSCMQFGNPDGAIVSNAKITVWTRLNGVRCHAIHIGKSTNEADKFFNPAVNFPRYIYYPDASAYKMEIYISDSQKYILNLTPHDSLNGAYYYSGSFAPDPTPTNAEPDAAISETSVSVPSKIYTSEINNPFVFPVLGINTVGSGEIYGICSAAKALSQGQFGQFPLYAFTSEGVWALETNATGTYSARQPITRDVCINASSITQIDSAVLFATARGIMLISGSQTQCISDIINSDTPFDVLALPGMEKLHALLGHDDQTCLPIAPFSEFLQSCGMVYDYVHQRVILYSTQHTYAYVYSFKSHLWGMQFLRIERTVNAYPEALAVDKDNKLVDFALAAEGAVGGLLVSRPLKLDSADILKTVDSFIQRGDFRKGNVQSVLYGSRDLDSWHLVWSSKDHFLRGFRGTPYKYFRIALLCNLSPGESLFGASVQFNPRLTNQPR